MDPLVTPLLVLVLGNLAQEIISDACKDYLKDKLKSVFGWLETLGERDKVELAYQDAMEQAYSECLEMLLHNIKGFGYTDDELKEYGSSLKAFIKDERVAKELLNAVREPAHDNLPSPDVLRERWQAVGGKELPSDTLWNAVVAAFKRKATKQIILSDNLRDLLNAQNLQQLRELIERQGGVKVQVRRDRYSQRMRIKFSAVDLANLMPAYADDPGRMVIRDVFVPQHVRENPPSVEIPKDIVERLMKRGGRHDEAGSDKDDNSDEQQLERVRAAYARQSPKPVLEVIAEPSNRLLVLTGDPGSGKSTLARYLLTGIIEPPVDVQTGSPLPWTQTFQDAFPLLIDLRNFHALRCDDFLEYVDQMGKSEQWFVDDHAADDYLDSGVSLVMFDGLDEIFDLADRERVMHQIAGFAHRYGRARIVVTSRPVGYKEHILRNAGFAHYGIQDLDETQIETFVQGWFSLTFPQQPQQASQRIERVLGSVRSSRPIRLLAGNPMLLTIMVLLAREEELPRARAKFYEKAVEVLCHHWDANRNLTLPRDQYLNAGDKTDLLRRIAMRMQAGEAGLKGNVILEDDLEEEIQAFLIDEQWQSDAAEAKKAARLMIQQLRERNYILCLRGPEVYGFVHRTFLEYLTAAEFVRRFDRQPQQMTFSDTVELFDKHCREDDWREVLRLICAEINEQFVGQIVEHLATRADLQKWTGKPALSELPLAIGCLSELRNVSRLTQVGKTLLKAVTTSMCEASSPDFQHDLIRACDELGDRWPGREALGETVLSQPFRFARGTIPTQRFWPKFCASLGAERAQIEQLAKTTSAPYGGVLFRYGAITALADKWPDDATRKLIAECAVHDQDEQPRSGAITALADKWPDDATRQLIVERALHDQDGYLRASALGALANTWPDEATHKLVSERAVQDQDERGRVSALAALVDKWPDDATRKLVAERAVHDQDEHPRAQRDRGAGRQVAGRRNPKAGRRTRCPRSGRATPRQRDRGADR